MTHSLALLHLLAATKTTKTNPFLTLLPLILIAVAGYFFFLKPQQRKAAAARAAQSSGYEVGDEVQTIGGVVGTILEIHGDRYTLLTGSTEEDGNLGGAQPTRIVFVRQAIARKVERIVDVDDDDEEEGDHSEEHEGYGLSHDHFDGQHDHDHDHDVDDEGPSGVETQAHHEDGEAEGA